MLKESYDDSSGYKVEEMLWIPYLDKSFSAKEPCD